MTITKIGALYRSVPLQKTGRDIRGNMGIQGGWSKQIWLRLYLKLVAVVGFLIQILNNILNLL